MTSSLSIVLTGSTMRGSIDRCFTPLQRGKILLYTLQRIWASECSQHAAQRFYVYRHVFSASTGTSSTSTSTGTSSARLPERLLPLRLPARPQRVYRNVFYFYVISMSTARLPARLQHVFRHVTQHAYFQIYSDQSPLLLVPHSRPMTPQH